MERLTKRGNGHAYYPRCFKEPCYGSGCKIKDCPFETAVCERLAAYEDTGLTPEQVANAKTIIESAFAEDTSKAERIRTLLAADKDGRCVVLPCKQGDTVWFKTYKNSARDCIGIQPHEVTRISVEIIVQGEFVDIGIPVSQIGRRIFLSESEAVAADTEPLSGSPIVKF